MKIYLCNKNQKSFDFNPWNATQVDDTFREVFWHSKVHILLLTFFHLVADEASALVHLDAEIGTFSLNKVCKSDISQKTIAHLFY